MVSAYHLPSKPTVCSPRAIVPANGPNFKPTRVSQAMLARTLKLRKMPMALTTFTLGPKPLRERRGTGFRPPNKGFFLILRLYGPLQPWFDKAWQPGEIELMKQFGN